MRVTTKKQRSTLIIHKLSPCNSIFELRMCEYLVRYLSVKRPRPLNVDGSTQIEGSKQADFSLFFSPSLPVSLLSFLFSFCAARTPSNSFACKSTLDQISVSNHERQRRRTFSPAFSARPCSRYREPPDYDTRQTNPTTRLVP